MTAAVRVFRYGLRRPHTGFDLVLGNPPFFWGNRIGRAFGPAYRDWLQTLHPGAHGNSDLAAHFLRRGFALLRDGGGFVVSAGCGCISLGLRTLGSFCGGAGSGGAGGSATVVHGPHGSSGRRVNVGPPLSCSGPSFGSVTEN